MALKAGLPGVYFVGMSNEVDEEILRPFDMLAEFGPGSFIDKLPRDFRSRAVRLWRRQDFGRLLSMIVPVSSPGPFRFEYRDVIEAEMAVPLREKYAPCVLQIGIILPAPDGGAWYSTMRRQTCSRYT